MKVGVLNGKKVITLDGQVLGDVEDTEISVESWAVTNIYVALTKEISDKFKFDKPFLGSVTVYLPIETIATVGEVILLNKDVESLKAMKEFKVQD